LDLEGILPHVDIFLPNYKEVLHLTRQADLASALVLLEQWANTIVVKMGSEGSLLFKNGHTTRQAAFLNEDVVDAIGAGDSFNAGFLFKYIQQESMEVCQEFGNMMGAYSTTAAGGTGAFASEENILENVKERFGYVEK
jgi:sugar/nucleoside kinase (ribokinase family)